MVNHFTVAPELTFHTCRCRVGVTSPHMARRRITRASVAHAATFVVLWLSLLYVIRHYAPPLWMAVLALLILQCVWSLAAIAARHSVRALHQRRATA